MLQKATWWVAKPQQMNMILQHENVQTASENWANPACWPIVQITVSMSVAEGWLIAGRNISLVINTTKLLIRQYSKLLRIKSFKAKAPRPTWEIFNCMSCKSCRNAEIECSVYTYISRFKANHDRAGGMWNGSVGEKVFFCGLCMRCRIWYLGLWDLGKWGRDADYRCQCLEEVSYVLTGGTKGCFCSDSVFAAKRNVGGESRMMCGCERWWTLRLGNS